MKKISLYLQAFFYVFAGLNHFINPEFYFPLIPDYFQGFSGFINAVSGIIEIGLGISLVFPALRKQASIGIILMLLAFIPSHVYFIQIGSCIDGGLCIPEWIGWVRLVIIHPLLILWAYNVYTYSKKAFVKS